MSLPEKKKQNSKTTVVVKQQHSFISTNAKGLVSVRGQSKQQ